MAAWRQAPLLARAFSTWAKTGASLWLKAAETEIACQWAKLRDR